MGWKKGESGNPEGRKAGQEGKDKQLLRTFLTSIVEDEGVQSKLKEALDTLKGKEYIAAYTSLAEYCIGKMRTTELVNAPDDVLRIQVTRTVEDD